MSSEETPRHPELPESVLRSGAESASRSVSVGGWLAQFFYGGMPFWSVFVTLLVLFVIKCHDYRDFLVYHPITTYGKIIRCQENRFWDDDRPRDVLPEDRSPVYHGRCQPTYRIEFVYPPSSGTQTCYSGGSLKPGSLCRMECHQSPRFGKVYRPVGTNFAVAGASMLSLAIISLFGISAVGLWIYVIVKGRRNLQLLRRGKLVRAQEVERKNTGVILNNRAVFRIVFCGVSEEEMSQTYVVKTTDIDDLPPKSEVWLLADVTGNALILDTFLKTYQFTENGDFRLKSSVSIRFFILVLVEIGLIYWIL